ncbi:MAG: hypothetical protein R3246_14915, partial [Acidimicrobiia bacterium]|nr:hypothetical protein [Acidimicrobiia bacterium]
APSTVLLVAIALAASACGAGQEPQAQQPVAVSGFAHAGPTCPVISDDPGQDCADRPVGGALIEIRDGDADLVTTVVTDLDGWFATMLPAGGYRLIPHPVDGLLGTPEPFDFQVGVSPVELDVAYDTGIR